MGVLNEKRCKIKMFINYISCKLVLNSEEPYYEELPEDEIKSIFF
jgi:hypothetical protein